MYDVNYHRASSVSQAAKLMKGAEDGKILAGGMTLLPTMKMRLAQPEALVDLSAIPTLSGITVEGGTVTIGESPGGGTRVTVQLPLSYAPESSR